MNIELLKIISKYESNINEHKELFLQITSNNKEQNSTTIYAVKNNIFKNFNKFCVGFHFQKCFCKKHLSSFYNIL